jgi:hypothetical protein
MAWDPNRLVISDAIGEEEEAEEGGRRRLETEARQGHCLLRVWYSELDVRESDGQFGMLSKMQEI